MLYRRRHAHINRNVGDSGEKWLSHVKEHLLSLRPDHSLSPFVDAGTECVKRKHHDQEVTHEMEEDLEAQKKNCNLDFEPSLLHESPQCSNGLRRDPSSNHGNTQVLEKNPFPHYLLSRRSSLFLEGLTSPDAVRNERMAAPGACSETLFPSTKLQGLQETDPGSLLGLRTPEVMEEVVSGRRTTGSLYRPPFSIPTPNPVSKSSVGMMGRGSQRGKRPLTSSWEGKIFLEVPGRGIGREGKPLPLSGSKLHAVAAPMSAAKQTVSSREPSLLLALNFSPAPSVSTGLIPKTSTGQ